MPRTPHANHDDRAADHSRHGASGAPGGVVSPALFDSADRVVPEPRDDRVGVVDAAAPGAAADGLQGGPEAGVVGQVGVGREVGVGRARGEDPAPSSAPNSTPSAPTRSTVPSRRTRSTTIRIRSPSRTRPIGPPARASGPTWPMQAPVETPENRASVSTATCLPKDRCLQRRR